MSYSFPSYHGEERRAAERVPLCLPAAAECDAWMNLCHTKDISKLGIFLISQRVPSIRVGFSIELRLPGGKDMLRVHAMVVRVQEDFPRGFGLRYKDPSPENLEILSKLLQRWNQAFYTWEA